MPEINSKTILDENGNIFLQVREHFIDGDILRSYESLRIVRIDSTGNETNFEWLINDRRYAPREGDFILFSGTDLRMPIVRRKPSNVRITVITFKPLTVFPHTVLISFFYMKNKLRHHIRAGESEAVAELFDKVTAELYHNDPYSKIAASSALLLLIVELCRTLGYPETTLGKSKSDTKNEFRYSQSSCELVGNITSYIGDHFTEKLTIVSVSQKFGISESLLSKLMNGIIGISFPEYVRRLRVNNVVRLIRENNFGVLEAAIESGFTSVTGFYKTFRDITGTSPNIFCKE